MPNPAKELRQAKMLKHSLQLTIAHLKKKKKDVSEYKKKLTVAKRNVTLLTKKLKV